jgi:CheY-like chemotaxis protein
MQEPDAVLLDILLPGVSGFEVLKEVREFLSVTIPLYRPKGHRRRCDETGGRGYEDMAKTIILLYSDASSHITGHALPIEGDWIT